MWNDPYKACQESTTASADKGEWVLGWRCLIAAAAGTGVGFSMFALTSSLFIVPMQAAFGWSRTAVTIAPLIGFLAMFVSPLVGAVVDRLGARPIAIIGLCTLVLAYLALAAFGSATLLLYVLLAPFAVIGPMTSAIVFTRPVADWFDRNVGLAFALTMTGVSLVGVVAIPITNAAISWGGWRAGYVALAGIVAIIGFPVVIRWLHQRDSDANSESRSHDRHTAHTFSQAVRDVRLWILAAALGLAAIPIGGFMGHLQPVLVDRGLTPAEAAGVGSLFAFAIGVGRLLAGWLLGRAPPPVVAAGCLLLACLGAWLLGQPPSGDPWLISAVAMVLVAFAYGAEADFLGFFCLRLFGLRAFGTLFGFLSTFVVGGLAIGGIAFAAGFDAFGNYRNASYCGAILFFISAALLSTLKIPAGRSASMISAKSNLAPRIDA